MATRYRVERQTSGKYDKEFIMLQDWNSNLLLQKGDTPFTRGPNNEPWRRIRLRNTRPL